MTVYCAYGTVIFSLRESDMETCGFSDIIFATTNTHTKPKTPAIKAGVFGLAFLNLIYI